MPTRGSYCHCVSMPIINYLPEIERETDNSQFVFLEVFQKERMKVMLWTKCHCDSIHGGAFKERRYVLLEFKQWQRLRTQRYLRAWPDYSPNRTVIPRNTFTRIRVWTFLNRLFINVNIFRTCTFSTNNITQLFFYTICAILSLRPRRVLTHNRILILFKYKIL